MAFSTCGKCGGHSFELSEVEPRGSRVKMYFVQCGSCGTPVGVTDFFPNSTMINRIDAIDKKLKSIEGEVDTVSHNIRILAQNAR